MRRRELIPVVGLAVFSVLAVQVGDAWARAGGGGGGGRGSRSYSAPVRPSPSPASPATPTSPSRSLTQPASPVAPARPGLFGGLMGGIAGFALGGLLGSMLFGGLGGGFGGGFGLMEMLILGGVVMLAVMYFRKKRQAAEPAYATAGGSSTSAYTGNGANTGIGGTATMETPVATMDKERGLAHIKQMDQGFDPGAFGDEARSMFMTVQGTLAMRDMGRLRNRLTPEMYVELQAQCDRLRGARRSNHVEKIDIRGAEITEAWQEAGQDYLTVQLTGSLLDYVVDDASGSVVEGSKTEADTIEEYWTFTRPVGPNPWILSSIQTL